MIADAFVAAVTLAPVELQRDLGQIPGDDIAAGKDRRMFLRDRGRDAGQGLDPALMAPAQIRNPALRIAGAGRGGSLRTGCTKGRFLKPSAKS